MVPVRVMPIRQNLAKSVISIRQENNSSHIYCFVSVDFPPPVLFNKTHHHF
jgi:hypothetical protein